jgi:predicted transcriptional regulator
MTAWQLPANSAVRRQSSVDGAIELAQDKPPHSIDEPDVEEDIRRLREFERTGRAVPAAEVKAWIDSWGTANELPRPQPRKIM